MTGPTATPPAPAPPPRALHAVLGASVALVGLLFLRSPGTSDVPLFMRWMDNIDRLGMVGGYAANQTVHPPVYAVIFWIIAKVADGLGVSHFVAFKVSLLLVWLLTGVCLWQWTRNSLTIAAVLLALIPNSLALGYFDIYLAPPLLGALWAARAQRWAAFSLSFALFALIKGQGLILIPFAVIFVSKAIKRGRGAAHGAARIAVAATAPAALIGILCLGLWGGAFISAVHLAMHNELLSGNALNLGWILTHYLRSVRPELFGGLAADGTAQWIAIPATHALRMSMRVAFFTAYGAILLMYARRGASLHDFVLYSLLGFLAYFTLNTGVHENHLTYGALLATVLFLIDVRYLPHAVICWLAANANMILFYGLSGRGLGFSRVVGVDLALPFACVNVLFFLVAVAPIFGRARRQSA